MTCTCGKSYIIRPNDTFFLIAERELGNGDRSRASSATPTVKCFYQW